MSEPQPGILAPVPALSRYLEFAARPDTDPRDALAALAATGRGDEAVIGIGPGLILGMGRAVAGLRAFPAIAGPGCTVPSTQTDIWC